MKNGFESLVRICKQLLYILNKKQKKEAVWVLFAMLMTSVLELLGVSVIYPFLESLLSLEKLRSKWYISWIYRWSPDLSDKTVIICMGITIIVVFLIKNACALYFSYVQYSFAARFRRDISTKTLELYLRRPYEFFINTNSSILIRGINVDIDAVYNVLLNLFQMIGELLTITLIGVFLIITDWFIAICSLLLSTGCFLAIVAIFKNPMKSAGKKYREANADSNRLSYQAINGIKEITVLDRRDNFVNQYYLAACNATKATLINNFLSACPDRILEGVCIGGIIGIVCIRISGGVDLRTFVPVLGSFAMGAFKILPSISKLSNRVNGIVYYQFGLKSCYDNMIEVNKQDEEEKAGGHSNNVPRDTETSKNPIDFNNSIRIDKIRWKYINSQNYVLDNLSLSIKKGESIALIGSSGAGKTTLADVIMSLLIPQSGTIYVDDKEILKDIHAWRALIGYVPQSVYLIDDTIRANVAFGLTGEEVSDEKVWGALDQAQLRSFVEGLTKGLDTVVGERGVKLSGGQRQRIAIARALYMDPEIMVLDEATSALDNETEEAVMEAIEALQGHKTLIIVAHRLTTIRNCDKIFEIVDGVAVERKKEEVLGEEVNQLINQ